jgi:hypothetical protein
VVLLGTWATHPKYGRQFKVETMEHDLDLDPEGLIHYLANHPDIADNHVRTALTLRFLHHSSFSRLAASREILAFAAMSSGDSISVSSNESPERVYYAGPKFSAGRLLTSTGDEIQFAGNLFARENQPVVLLGTWATHPKYGRQFKVETMDGGSNQRLTTM